MIAILLLCMAVGGIDNPPIEPMTGTDEDGMEWMASPGLLPVVVATKAIDVVDAVVMGQPDYLQFLSDAWWPCNISQNITRNLTA